MHVVPLLPTKPAPSHLSTEAKSWWSQLVAEFSITDPGGLLLLQTACEAYDRMQQARRAIEADGLMSKGSKRQARAHPLLAVERDAQKALLASLRALNLDLEPLRDRPGRPAGGWGAK
ncbi:MAG TPA: phage terminase small subunit P27 family [Burkholderiales bacterium]|jgi:P27 family predicted phage terminase small subunit|nr:phage terminase small subunit P27 family [Burkholderiales bacterium]